MKKLFVSCPMRGRTNEAIARSIERMHVIAEAVLGEELEVLDSFRKDDPEISNPLKMLGKSIEIMSEADAFIGISYTGYWRGCDVEHDIAEKYLHDGAMYLSESQWGQFMPDAWELMTKAYGPFPTPVTGP